MCLFCLLFGGTGYSDRYLLSGFITINHLWWFQADMLTTDNSVVTVQEGETGVLDYTHFLRKSKYVLKSIWLRLLFFLHVLHLWVKGGLPKEKQVLFYHYILFNLLQLDPRFFQSFLMRVDDLNLTLIFYHQDIDVKLN